MKTKTRASNPINKHVGARVRTRRMTIGMTQQKLGYALGLTSQEIQNYEKGTSLISASTLQKMVNILGVPVAFFFEGLSESAAPESQKIDAPSSSHIAARDGHALVLAFRRITTPHTRRIIIDLVEALAQKKRP